MSIQGMRLKFIHLCTTQRSGAGTDDWGNPAAPVWVDHLTDLPCRVWASAGREAVTDNTTVVVVEDLRLLCPLDSDVTETDQVSIVTSRGDTILAGPVQIRSVLRHTDHLELLLTRIA